MIRRMNTILLVYKIVISLAVLKRADMVQVQNLASLHFASKLAEYTSGLPGTSLAR